MCVHGWAARCGGYACRRALTHSQVNTLELSFLGLVAESVMSKDLFLLPSSHGRDGEEALRPRVK